MGCPDCAAGFFDCWRHRHAPSRLLLWKNPDQVVTDAVFRSACLQGVQLLQELGMDVPSCAGYHPVLPLLRAMMGTEWKAG